MKQWLQQKLNVFVNVSLKQCRVMHYVRNEVTYLSLHVNGLNVTPTQLLNVIKYYKTRI